MYKHNETRNLYVDNVNNHTGYNVMLRSFSRVWNKLELRITIHFIYIGPMMLFKTLNF